jgi:hypothetical protein
LAGKSGQRSGRLGLAFHPHLAVPKVSTFAVRHLPGEAGAGIQLPDQRSEVAIRKHVDARVAQAGEFDPFGTLAVIETLVRVWG